MGKRFSLFIARRLRNTPSQTFSKNVTRIGIGTIALGISILIIAFSILRGFQKTIYDKIYHYNGQIEISLFIDQQLNKPAFFNNNQNWIKELKKHPEILEIEEVIQSPSLIISEKSMQGILLCSFNEKKFPEWKNPQGLYLGRGLSKFLDLKIQEKMILYFIGEKPIPKKLLFAGTYHTGLEEIDKNLGFASKSWLQKSLRLESNKISNLKIYLKEGIDPQVFYHKISKNIPPNYSVRTMDEIYPGLFDWMKLLDKNILILIGLLVVVAGFNIIATLYILMIERIPMIGILKSLGANHQQLKNIFWWNGTFILIRGLIIGNIVGIGFSFIQAYFHLIPLNEEIYYMSFVPIQLSLSNILTINLFTILFVFLIALIPTKYLDKLNPLEAIQFKT